MQDKKLIDECKKDKTAFEKLYRKYVDDVYRYIYVVVNHREKAEDITSQTFLIAFEKIKKFEWREISIKFWFLKIARNLVSKSLRKAQSISFDEKIEIKNVDKILTEDIIIEEELKNKIKQLIFRLDERTREIISLKIWEDLKFREISKILEMKQSTVINRFARGIKKLKNMVEEDLRKAQEERKKRRKKLFAINLVTIIIGTKYLKNAVELLPTKGFKDYLSNQIASKFNLPIIKTNMKIASTKGPKALLIKIAIAGTILVSFGGIGGYFLYKQSNLADDENIEESIKEEGTESDDEVSIQEDPYSGWKTYENLEKEIWFKYPSDWLVEEDLNNPMYYSITATDGKDHSIRFYGQDDTYPYYCIYPDTNQDLIPGDPLGINREFSDYTEVKNETVSYRRARYIFGNGSFELTVCKEQEDGLYITEYTYIGYEVPDNSDTDKLEILDKILLSYEKVYPKEEWITYTDVENIYTIETPSDWVIVNDYEQGTGLPQGKISYTTFNKDIETDGIMNFEIGKLDSATPAYQCGYAYEDEVKTEIPALIIDEVSTYYSYSIIRDESNQGQYGGIDFYEEHYCIKSPSGRDLNINFSVPMSYKTEGVALFHEILETLSFI